jgi:hypothetical protein
VPFSRGHPRWRIGGRPAHGRLAFAYIYVLDVRVDFRHGHACTWRFCPRGNVWKAHQPRTCRNGKNRYTACYLNSNSQRDCTRTFECVPSALPPGRTREDVVASGFDYDKCHVSVLDSQASVRSGHGSCHLWPHRMGQIALSTTRTYTALRYVHIWLVLIWLG